MPKQGWANGAAPAQGAADSPHFGEDMIAKGFSWGVNQLAAASRSASPMPPNIANSTGEGMLCHHDPRVPWYTKPH